MDNKWFRARSITLEFGRGYCRLNIYWVDHQIGRERLYKFAEQNDGYCVIENPKTNKYEIYNLNITLAPKKLIRTRRAARGVPQSPRCASG